MSIPNKLGALDKLLGIDIWINSGFSICFSLTLVVNSSSAGDIANSSIVVIETLFSDFNWVSIVAVIPSSYASLGPIVVAVAAVSTINGMSLGIQNGVLIIVGI